ncbi:MAG TPA: c-type cytochrome biogenesis protein CcmI [Stellaceae bacterium]
MLLALALAVMTVVVVATVLAPLMKGAREAPSRAQFDRAVYRDQLKELERDLARGLIDADQAATARLEIERRLLAADARPEAAPARGAGSPLLALSLALALPAAAALIYLALGSPGVPDQPYAARGPERARFAATGQHEDLDKAAAALEEKLKANPESDADWLLLARTQAALGRWQRSAEAYREAMRLTKGRPDVASAYGEMLVFAADGIVTPRAREAFTAALARDPADIASRYYLALADAQEGKAQAAIDAWQKLATDQGADSKLRAELEARIADTAKAAGLPVPELAAPAGGPGIDDMAKAAQMTPEQRQQMIGGMVEGLAAKLKSNPDDLAGWMRLARAYAVLNERDKAADAYERAAKLKPDDPQILLAEADALIIDRSPQTPLPARAVALLQRVDALDPRQPAALWYLGLAAAQQRRFAEARSYWQRLLPLLPADGDQHKAVAAAIEALKDK